MSYDKELAEKVRNKLQGEEGFSERHMFGGVGFMLYGNMCCGVNQSNLIVRVGPDNYETSLSKDYVKEFDMTGRPMRGWVVVEPGGAAEAIDLKTWIGEGMSFARSLPPK